ncbi:MAG TPA: adenylate/guanylate cyclase domain-containing protein, partial [Tepidisphaeraceae bacterium]|nr:adenylate/guanylate cyclase domain-containing protein [Tepidisphaeraceae bacterium]
MPAIANRSRLMVMLFSDIVGSTGLKSKLGVPAYSRLLARHDEIFQQITASTPGSAILNDLGDGYFVSFETPSDAVRAALLLQQAMAREPWPEEPIQIRLGIHLGELAELDDPRGPAKLTGLAADIASHLASLAQPGQILLTRAAFNEARQFVSDHPRWDNATDEELPKLTWMAHGPYLIKGIDEATEVFEVGAAGIAPLSPPP